MLRVEVWLDPSDGSPDRKLSEVTIENDRTGTEHAGNYIVRTSAPGRPGRYIINHARILGFLPLVARAFASLSGLEVR